MAPSFLTRHPILRDAINIVVFVVLVVIGTVLINSFVFRSFSVMGPSMETTLYTGDRLIVNRLPVTWAKLQNKSYLPERGQIIVFKNPHFALGADEEYIVKRVIGLPGERVILKDGQFTVINSEHPEGFDPDEGNNEVGHPISGETDVFVPANNLFVAGDHRTGSYSLDSRNGLGMIPLYDIIGPVSTRIYPFDKIRLF